MTNSNDYLKILNKTFKKCNITYNGYDKREEELNCFLKTQQDTDEYPERLHFNIYTFKDVKKDNKYILKYKDSRLIFSINDKIVKIIDIFIHNTYQQKGIAKELVYNLKYFIEKEYPSIEFITLSSLPTGVIAWYKIGFDFYHPKHKLQIKTILAKILNKKIDIKSVSKQEVEETNFYDIVWEKIGYIPMYLKVKQ